jgi:hypothetical protein
MYKRKTEDNWDVQGDYGYGFDRLTTECSLRDARQTRKEYVENDISLLAIRIIKYRTKRGN